MSNIEFEAKKAELARNILDENDEWVIDSVTEYLKKIKASLQEYIFKDESENIQEEALIYNPVKSNTQFDNIPIENLKTEIHKSEKAYEKGLFISHDKMKKRHPRI